MKRNAKYILTLCLLMKAAFSLRRFRHPFPPSSPGFSSIRRQPCESAGLLMHYAQKIRVMLLHYTEKMANPTEVDTIWGKYLNTGGVSVKG